MAVIKKYLHVCMHGAIWAAASLFIIRTWFPNTLELTITCFSLYPVSKYKNDSLEYQNSKTDRASPPDRNGRISPDSGAISMSPGVESTEGHGQLEDEIIDGSDHRSNKSNSRMNAMNEALNHSGSELNKSTTKRVAFRDPLPPSTNSGPQHNSFEKLNGMTHQPMLCRSYTYDQADFPVDGMNMKMQRTASFSQAGRPIPPQMQFSTFPGSYPMLQQHQHFTASSYSLPPEQHRLPRVHRGGMGYDGNMVPPMLGPPYQQAPPPPRIIQQQQLHPRPPGLPPQQSAFQRVPKQGSFRQYENVIVHPAYYPQPQAHHVHTAHPPPPPQPQPPSVPQDLQKRQQQPFGGRPPCYFDTNS